MWSAAIENEGGGKDNVREDTLKINGTVVIMIWSDGDDHGIMSYDIYQVICTSSGKPISM